jgi:hypothetical protein
MQKLSLLILLCITFGCGQNKFVSTKVLTRFKTDTIYYDAFQTGVDNYRIEIKAKSGNVIDHLFDYYIDDGIFTSTTLRASTKGDTTFILSKYPVDNEIGHTRQGKSVIMKRAQVRNFSNIPDYVILVRHFYGGEGEMLNWRITRDSIKITYNCDWEGCKDTLLYHSFLDSITSEKYLEAIKAMRLDSLKGIYENKSLRDGLYVNFESQNVFEKPVKFSLHGINFKAVDAFYQVTDSLLFSNTRYKLSRQ